MSSSRDPWVPTACADCGKPIKFYALLTERKNGCIIYRAVCTECYWKEKKK